MELTESAGNIVFRFLLLRVSKDLSRRANLYNTPLVKEGSLVGDTRGLLHVVGNNHDGDTLFKL